MKSPPPKDNGNGHVPKQEKETSDDRPADSSIDVLIEEAQALKDVLREAHGRASRLLVGLKRHRHQGRLLRTTPASLRQLQQIGG